MHLIDEEITYAMYLGLRALIFQPPDIELGINQLARLINAKIILNQESQNLLPNIWIEIPTKGPMNDTWIIWNQLRTQITPDKHLAIALELTTNFPTDLQLLQRWTGEPIKALILPTSIFTSNNKENHPVLSKSHEKFIRLLINKMACDIQFVIKNDSNQTDMRNYCQYVDNLKANLTPMETLGEFAADYDILRPCFQVNCLTI
jgi:type II protein arginine methyltransferase